MEATPTPARKKQKRAGGERRGSSKDRAARRRNLMRHWGNGTTCECAICGMELFDHPREMFSGGIGPIDHIENDKIVPHEDGPGYRMTNLYPSCRKCNLARGDMPLEKFLGAERAAFIIDHAAAYKRQRAK